MTRDHRSCDDVTPLMSACSLGRMKGSRVALTLIEAGNVRYVRAADGIKALKFATGGRSAEVIQALIDRGGERPPGMAQKDWMLAARAESWS